MLRWLIEASLRNRFLVLLLAALAIIAGGFAVTRLPIDAVPDITNRPPLPARPGSSPRARCRATASVR